MACEKDCGAIATERMRYFTGRYMTARDFSDEQSYYLTHRYLHNRMLHGWGVVCGLHVYPHPVEGCRKDHVRLDCGMAIDCCGREIVVPKPFIPPPIPWDKKPGAGEAQSAEEAAGPAASAKAEPGYPEKDEPSKLADDKQWYPLLCLEFCQSEIECVPVLYSEGNCDPQRREFSRVSESYKFSWHWVRYSDLPKYHWKITGGGCPEARREADGRLNPCPEDDCDEPPHDEPAKCCLDPQCPPDHCVPLAWIHAAQGTPITMDQIVILGRPSLQSPRDSLTHICAINWPHGGVVRRSHLEEHLRRLEIRFDRRLKRIHEDRGVSGPRGVNPATFVVQFGGGYEDLDFVTYADPPHVEHGCIAVFTIDPRGRRSHREVPYAYLENQTVFITLKCDFILDCHDVAVDGNYLGGILPSGDGIRGGTFESWFRVVPDYEWDQHQRQQHEQHEEQELRS